ncbi:MAG: tetratricopeptide repeat protein [Myxococcaceae bacterium]|nr:tetratricopeptide repeat protein [Myxococcaceae bacterium]
MPENKSDLDRELGDLKKEIIESRNLVIKTDNLLKNLHAELKAVGKRQEEFEKRRIVSSATAYVLFALLAGAAAVLISNARVASAAADKERDQKTIEQLSKTIAEARAAEAARKAAAGQAFEVYRQMTQLPGDERLKGVEAYARMEMTHVSPLEKQALKDRAEALREEIGQAAFERGKQAFRRADMDGTIQELTRFMAMNPRPEDAGDASFFLGCAYHQQRKFEQAAQYLSAFVTADKKSRNRDYAMLLLSQAYEQTGALQKAADVAREAIATYPNSEYQSQLRARLGAAKRAINAAGGNPAPQPAAAAGAAQ